MYECHWWAALRWADEVSNTEAQMSAIRQAIDQARSGFSMEDITTPGNDLRVVYVHGIRNHRVASIERLFAVIANEAPESYGLLYVQGDEDERGLEFENCFRVWRLTRGAIAELADPFLSPCVPAIELPYDAAADE